MRHNSTIHHRRSIRFLEYDYSQAGAYFVTLCTQKRECLFGDITAGKMQLNAAGEMIQAVWDQIPQYYCGIEPDEFIIMPNHIHGIILIIEPMSYNRHKLGQTQGSAPTISLSQIVQRFKTMSTNRYITGVNQYGWPPFPGKLWQRNYWKRIVRNDAELDNMREYIYNNPAQWETDQLTPYLP